MTNHVLRNRRLTSAVLAVATVVSVLATKVHGQPPLPLRLSAFAVNMSNVGPTGATRIDITIQRWSTDAERQGLLTTFAEKGPDKLLDALQDASRWVASTRPAILDGISGTRATRRCLMADRDRHSHRSPRRVLGSAESAAHDRLSVHAHRPSAQGRRHRRR